MPRSLAAGKRKVAILATRPANLKAPTLAELNAGKDASCRILAGGFTLAVQDSETVAEGSLCDFVVPEVFTTAKASGAITVFRYFNAAGQAETSAEDVTDAIGDDIYQVLKERGSEITIVTRFTSKNSTDPWAEGDEVSVFVVSPDYPRQSDGEGHIKSEHNLSVLAFEPLAEVAATTP